MLFAGLLVAASLMSCAEERDPINRVQPNVIKKAMLQGTWYFHQKVVDVPGGMLQGFFIPSVVGWYSDPDRVRFDIQENFLYIRRINELAHMGEQYAYEWDEEFSTYAILAAYRISKHFDIQRDYNSVTGESYNVISENSMDRPWWEREYMRVDWSQNMAPGFSFDAVFVPSDPVPYYVQDSCTPDLEFAAKTGDRCIPDTKAPFFDIVWNDDGTDLTQGYFDITNMFTASPGTEYLEGYGDIPACWLFGNEAMECSATMYFVRNSFFKYNENTHDYEPMPYSGAVSDQIGYFYSDYLTYDQQTVITEPGRVYMINRHNTWEQSHSWAFPNEETGEPRGIDWNQSDDHLFNSENAILCHSSADCCPGYDPNDAAAEASCKSICDMYTNLRPVDRVAYEERNSCKFHSPPQNLEPECAPTHYCTLPYNQRRVRPMVYYANPEWPEELARHPNEPKLVPPGEMGYGMGEWGYNPGHEPDQASIDAFKFAYADEEGLEARSMLEKVSDKWSAPYVRTFNILKMKAADRYNGELHANVPYIDDDMRRTEAGAGAFSAIGMLSKDGDGIPTGGAGFDENWYDPERPPFVVCRFSPVLGPDNDPNGVEPDICWERIQEESHCVFDPERPGVNPKTGKAWTEAEKWPLCSFREASPRLGDIRYSMTYWVPKWYDGFRLLGLGPGNSDMVSGETISGSAHMYMYNDMAARRVVDYTMLMTGDLEPGDYIDGYNLLGWKNTYSGSGTNPTAIDTFPGYPAAQLATMGGTMTGNMQTRGQQFTLDADTITTQANSDGLPSHGPEALKANTGVQAMPFTMDDVMRAAAFQYQPYVNDESLLRYVSEVPEGGFIEDDLLEGGQMAGFDTANTIVIGAGLPPTSDIDDEEVRDQILVTRRDPFKMAAARESMMDWLTVNKVMDFAATDEVNASLAFEVQRLRAEGKLPASGGTTFVNALWRMVRKKLMAAVTPHEIGHSVGLRHNFAGSEDVINYFEPYWEIRTNGCAESYYDYMAPAFDEVTTENPWDEANDCGNPDEPRVGLRFMRWEDGGDPMSKYEIYKKLYHYGYASVMDYNPYYHMDDKGIGRYDWAATLYGYGHHFEVFNHVPMGTGDDTFFKDWSLRDTWRPGFASEDAVDGCSITDDHEGGTQGDFTDIGNVQVGAAVVNMETGEQANVTNVASAYTIEFSPCFDNPVQQGDRYAVWGVPVFNTPTITGWGLDYIMEDYMRSGGAPMVLFYDYFFSPHYTEWYRNWTDDAGNPTTEFNDQDNRDVRDVRAFDWRVRSEQNSWEPGWYPLQDFEEDPIVRVPYAYCTDNGRDISNNCRTRDYGADDWERMHYHIADWEQYYISRSFIRSRTGFWPEDYPSAYYRRIYRTPKDYNNIYALYAEWLDPLYNQRQFVAMTIDPYNSWGGYTLALHDGFNMLMRTITAPDAQAGYKHGTRVQNGDFGLVADVVLGDGTAGFDIGQGGRVFETRYSNANYDNNCGNSFWRCLWNVGWYYDKIMAFNALSESATYFVARDTAHDIRLFRVSFFDDFNWQIKKYFSALMGENWNDLSPVVVVASDAPGEAYPLLWTDNPVIPEAGYTQPMIFWRDWANPAMDITNPNVYRNHPAISQTLADQLDDPDDDVGMRWGPVDPIAGFSVQVYAMVLGMARFQHNYDISFYNTARMWWSQGAAVDTIGDYVRYFDAENMTTYSAVASYGVNEVYHPYLTDDETGVGVAAAMIQFANDMKVRSTECDDTDVTPWTEDDCCDNRYDGDDDPEVEDCEEVLGYKYENMPSWDADDYAEAMDAFEQRQMVVDQYLKRYKGLLDFQVRLTKVYDEYMGFVGDEYDPGDTPEE
jgi:hypothetical protein